jgi:predicted Abi (CAAX) family protease
MILLPEPRDWGTTFLSLLGYAAIAISIGLKWGFLQWRPIPQKPIRLVKTLVFLFLCPALLEELVFRVLLLPYPDELNSPWIILGWSMLSLTLFILYHPFNALTFYKAGNPTFFQPVFLGLAALLGLTCTIVYLMTGSLWAIAFIHWVVVAIWLLCLNGLSKFTQKI